MVKSNRISRREFAASAGLAAMPALAQSPSRTPPLDDQKQAEAAAESRRRAIAEFDVPIETEPAFIFKT